MPQNSPQGTPTRSKYFPKTESEESDSPQEEGDAEDDTVYDTESSASISDLASETDDDFSDRFSGRKSKLATKTKTQKGKGMSNSSTSFEKGNELWREGVKTGLGPGKQVFIQKPKPRGDSGIDYLDERIHPNTFSFLADLKQNNDREWFKMHEPDYKASKTDWDTFVEKLTEKIIEHDETIPELPAKDLVFRIYRDVRFSKVKTPYKTTFSAAWSRTGRKGPYAAYYVQIAPGNSFVDSRVRRDILGGINKDEKKVVQAFTAQNAENALKHKPKDFDADHPNIELLKLRNWTMGRKLEDDEVLGDRGLSRISELIGAMQPFVHFLNKIVMPDEEDEPSDISDSE